jgi:hypothetical protein
MTTTEIKTIMPGGGGDYTSLNAWDLAERANTYPTIPNGDLVAADKIKVAEVYGTGNCLTGTIPFSAGWTTDTTHYLEIRAAAGHKHTGVWSTSKAYGSTAGLGISTSTVDMHITGMQLECTANGEYTDPALSIGNKVVVVDSCIIRIASSAGGASASNVVLASHATLATLKNCVIINEALTPAPNYGIVNLYGTMTLYNNTIVSLSSSSQAIVMGGGSGTLNSQNNYYRANSIYVNQGGATLNKGANDATSNTEAVTANLRSVPYSTATFYDITSGSENLRLVVSPSNKLLDNGANLTSLGITYDIVGTARPQSSAFDIGAFENDIPICWNYTARYKNSSKLFKVSGCGSFPGSLNVPENVDKSTGRMVDDGIEIDPDNYNVA